MIDQHTITVPDRLDPVSLAAFSAALEAVAIDSGRGVTVLCGTGGVFCRGLDLHAIAVDREAEAIDAAIDLFARALAQLRHLPVATIALVDGPAVGGGVGIAAACDHVIATADASFALPEALLGIAPAMIAPLLLERIAPQKLRAMALSGSGLSADEAHRLGLVDEITAHDSKEAAIGVAKRRFSRAAPGAVDVLRGTAWRPSDTSLADEISNGAATLRRLLDEPETRQRIKAFENGEAPWLG